MKIENVSEKVCPHCGVSQSLDSFNYHPSTRDRKQTWCKNCKGKSLREHRRNNLSAFRKREAGWARQYRKTPEGIYQQLRTNSKIRGIDFNIGKDEFVEWFSIQPNKCYYCKQEFNGRRGNDFGALTFDRKDTKLGYSLDNLVLACRKCNTIKGYWFTDSNMVEIANKYLMGKE